MNQENAVLAVWPATLIGAENAAEFEQWLKDEFKVTGEYAEEFETLPDYRHGEPVPDTGGRNDALFWIAGNDVMTFAVPRLAYGIRWWSDYIDGSAEIVPDEVAARYQQ